METNTAPKHGLPAGSAEYLEGFLRGLNRLGVACHTREHLEGYEDGLTEREGS